MIVSASRRTDIPNYYSDWFFNRIQEGYVLVRNPMNPHQISRIAMTPETIDCIVFWTKNPVHMLGSLDKLKGYPYYFQFTLTGYGKDMEPYVPDKRQQIIPAFQELSGKIGKERVIWRYDPILFTERYSMEYHLKAFTEIAGSLKGCTDKVVISFLDWYTKMKKNMSGILTMEHAEIGDFVGGLARIAEKNGIKITDCAEKMNKSGAYNPDSPLLCGEVGENDKITIRKIKSLKSAQISL